MGAGVWVRMLFDISIVCLFIDANFFGRNIEFLVQFLDGQRNVDCFVSAGFRFFCFFYGEFDPGSGRTLAACLTHASRTMKLCLHSGLVANG